MIACQKSWKSLRKMNGLPVTWQWMDFKRKFCESVLVLVFCYYLGFILMTSVVVFMLWTSSWFLAMNFLLSMIYFQFHACEMSTSSHNFPESQHKKIPSVTNYRTQQFSNIKAWFRILTISRERTKSFRMTTFLKINNRPHPQWHSGFCKAFLLMRVKNTGLKLLKKYPLMNLNLKVVVISLRTQIFDIKIQIKSTEMK